MSSLGLQFHQAIVPLLEQRMSVADLNDTHAIDGHLDIVEGPGGLPVINVRNDFASARIALHGAHVMDFRIEGGAPILWMSACSEFADNKPIRGGIPICWPWFGPHPENDELPAHGLARLRQSCDCRDEVEIHGADNDDRDHQPAPPKRASRSVSRA